MFIASVHHSDRGSQCASHNFLLLLNKYHMIGSMSHKVDCWDNAVAESFFKTLKPYEQVKGAIRQRRI